MKFKKPSFKIPRRASGSGASSSGVVGAHTRGTLYALVVTLAAVFLIALLVKFAGLSESVVRPLVLCVKAVAIFTGVYSALKSIEKRAWLHGGILGLVYTALAFVILSIIDSNFSITSGFLIETLFALLVGMASAMILRLRKRNI